MGGWTDLGWKEISVLTAYKLIIFVQDLNSGGVAPSEEKIAVVLNAPAPNNVSQAQPFVHLVQYSSKFIPIVHLQQNVQAISEDRTMGISPTISNSNCRVLYRPRNESIADALICWQPSFSSMANVSKQSDVLQPSTLKQYRYVPR